MEKLLRRTARAERVVAKQKAKIAKHRSDGKSWENSQQRLRYQRDITARIQQDRKNRKTDWETGVLAPRRDIGEVAKTYGALQMYNYKPADLDRDRPKKWQHVREGDRVVIVRGVDKGKIGVIDDVDKDKGTVLLKNVSVVEVSLPEWVKQQNNYHRDVWAGPAPIPLDHVQLVHPLPDPETGVPRDVVIERLVPMKRSKTDTTGGSTPRVIPGTNTIIPWPEISDIVHTDYEDDTLRITVDQETFSPHLMRPPMPLSVIDELRNKYSRFRTRHDYEYIQKKEMEEEKELRRKGLIKTMHTPRQELAERNAAKAKAAPPKELTPEQLARIGEVIAQARAKRPSAVEA